jgi:hypothetical protein
MDIDDSADDNRHTQEVCLMATPQEAVFKVLYDNNGVALGVEIGSEYIPLDTSLTENPIENVTVTGITITEVMLTTDAQGRRCRWVHHGCRRVCV